MAVRDDFNDDLLMPSKKERKHRLKNKTLLKFRRTFGAFRFAADSAAFRRMFRRIDVVANRQKLWARRVGVMAIVLGWAALLLAAASPVYPHDEAAHTLLGAVAIVLGVLGVLVALFGIFVVQKDWLRRRYCTERLRQFFFQNMLFRLPELIAAHKDPSLRPAFEAKSRELLSRLEGNHLKNSARHLKRIGEKKPDYQPDWLLPELDPALKFDPSDMNKGTLHADATEFYQLYELLRLNPQKNYAEYKLRKGGEIHFQEHWLGWAAVATIVLAFFMHFFIGSLIAWSLSAEEAEKSVLHLKQTRAWADVIVVWIAVTGLFFKAAEEGLQPKREAERYEDYEANCELAKQRFHKAKNKDGEQTLDAMLEFERVAYEEMKHFLRTNYDARFII